jgi:hypothetical protein
MELHQLIDAVHDQQSLLRFIKALAEDRRSAVAAEKSNPASPYGPDAGDWENITIEAYLESAAAWAVDTNFGATQGLSQSNPWRQFAALLYCGKIYE